MIEEYRGHQGWEYCEEDHPQPMCYFCTKYASYTIGETMLCFKHLVELHEELMDMRITE